MVAPRSIWCRSFNVPGQGAQPVGYGNDDRYVEDHQRLGRTGSKNKPRTSVELAVRRPKQYDPFDYSQLFAGPADSRQQGKAVTTGYNDSWFLNLIDENLY